MIILRILFLLLPCINPFLRQIASFYIQYISEDTIKLRWFLVLVNYNETEIIKIDSLRTGDCHVTFLPRYPFDKHLCDDVAHWWPEWHEYFLDNSNIHVYGARILFSPKRKLDLTKYMLWSNSVHLIDTFRFLHGHLILTHNMTSSLLTGILLYIIEISASLLLTN